MNKYLILLIGLYSFSCVGENKPNDNILIQNAKWYYYSYAIELKAYDKNREEVQPLTCDITLLKFHKISNDTTQIFFKTFSKDTLNLCSTRPLDLVGIAIIRKILYLPIYNHVVFDAEVDSIILERMYKQSILLKRRTLESNNSVNSWLQTEAKLR